MYTLWYRAYALLWNHNNWWKEPSQQLNFLRVIDNSKENSFHIWITFISLQSAPLLLKESVLFKKLRCSLLFERKWFFLFGKLSDYFLFERKCFFLSGTPRDCFLFGRKWFFLFEKLKGCFLFCIFPMDLLQLKHWNTPKYTAAKIFREKGK